MPEVGEEIVGTWLRYCQECDFVDYNVPIAGGAGEIDVIGFDLEHRRVYICEVATHTQGLGYRNNQKTILDKFIRAFNYAKSRFEGLEVSYMFWGPVVRRGQQRQAVDEVRKVLDEIYDIRLELVINKEYLSKLEDIREKASRQSRNSPHMVMRLLQIEEAAKRYTGEKG